MASADDQSFWSLECALQLLRRRAAAILAVTGVAAVAGAVSSRAGAPVYFADITFETATSPVAVITDPRKINATYAATLSRPSVSRQFVNSFLSAIEASAEDSPENKALAAAILANISSAFGGRPTVEDAASEARRSSLANRFAAQVRNDVVGNLRGLRPQREPEFSVFFSATDSTIMSVKLRTSVNQASEIVAAATAQALNAVVKVSNETEAQARLERLRAEVESSRRQVEEAQKSFATTRMTFEREMLENRVQYFKSQGDGQVVPQISVLPQYGGMAAIGATPSPVPGAEIESIAELVRNQSAQKIADRLYRRKLTASDLDRTVGDLAEIEGKRSSIRNSLLTAESEYNAVMAKWVTALSALNAPLKTEEYTLPMIDTRRQAISISEPTGGVRSLVVVWALTGALAGALASVGFFALRELLARRKAEPA